MHKGALPYGGRESGRTHRSYAVIGIASNARRGGTEPAPYRKTGNTQRAKAMNAQCRFEIYRAVIGLVSRKAECSE